MVAVLAPDVGLDHVLDVADVADVRLIVVRLVVRLIVVGVNERNGLMSIGETAN